MDFTIKKYKELLQALMDNNYSFQTFEDFLIQPNEKAIVLRHDVDLLPKTSLRFAKIQKSFGIRGTYYFRAVPKSWDEKIILEMAALGHEIGYHYENLTTCKGNFSEAIKDFETNLKNLRKLAPVNTACMHGSPMSKYDSKDLWEKYNYKDFDIKGTPYFDIDFDKVFYLTDTGRRWDGHKVSVRDKVNQSSSVTFHSTDEIIQAIKLFKLPNQIMFTFHPQRWHNNLFLWYKELIFQNLKNTIKFFFYVK